MAHAIEAILVPCRGPAMAGGKSFIVLSTQTYIAAVSTTDRSHLRSRLHSTHVVAGSKAASRQGSSITRELLRAPYRRRRRKKDNPERRYTWHVERGGNARICGEN